MLCGTLFDIKLSCNAVFSILMPTAKLLLDMRLI